MLNLETSAVANSTNFNATVQALTSSIADHLTHHGYTAELQDLTWLNSILRSASSESVKQLASGLESQEVIPPMVSKANLGNLNEEIRNWSATLGETKDSLTSSLKKIQSEISKQGSLSDYLGSGINVWMNDQLLIDGLPEEGAATETNKIKFSIGDSYKIKVEYPKNLSNTLQDTFEQVKKPFSINPSEGAGQSSNITDLPTGLPENAPLPAAENNTPGNDQPPPLNQGLPAATLPSIEDLENRITASVDWNTIEGASSSLGFGLNAYQGFRVQNVQDQVYQKNVSFMNPGIIRFHNGGMMDDSSTSDGLIDYTNQTWDKAKVVNGLAASYASFGDKQPERMINIPSWPSWMDVNQDGLLDSNQYDNYAKLCADLVRTINKDHNFNVKYWEITNEKDDQYFTHFRAAGGWGGLNDPAQPDRLNDLITIYNKVAIAMKEADPTIQVGGPGLARSDLQPFYIPFIKGTAHNLDFFTYHYYASGSASTPDQDIYAATNAIGERTATMARILKEASPKRDIPVMLGEYNISWTWQTRDPRMTNNKGIVFDALSIVRALENGATATMAWNEKDGVYGKTDNDNTMRLSGNFLQLMNQHLVGDRVATNTSNEKAVTTYAVTNNALNEKSYLIINHSSSEQSINLDFGDWSPKQKDVYEHAISSTGYSTKTHAWSDLSAGMNLPVDSVTLLTFAD